MPVLGHPLRNVTCHWLTSHPPGAKQGEVKEGRGVTPAREISFVSLVAYGPKVSLLSLSHGAGEGGGSVIASETRQGGSQQEMQRSGLHLLGLWMLSRSLPKKLGSQVTPEEGRRDCRDRL